MVDVAADSAIFRGRGKQGQSFAVSLNNLLEPCGLTFTFGPHNAAYRDLMRESLSAGDGTGVKVKIVDSGLSSSASMTPKSRTNIVDPANPTDVDDHRGHGTAVAEIIHAMAPRAELLIYKVVKGTQPITEWDVLAALCDDESADVINLSLAFGLRSRNCAQCGRQSHSSRSIVFEGTLRQLTKVSQDTLIVAAAGNGGVNPLVYPARFREAVAIGALDSTATRSSTSNYGNVDHKQAAHGSLFFAPGGSGAESVGSTSNGASYNGTSFAAAYASGLIAKLKSDPSYAGNASHLLQMVRKQANQNPAMTGFVSADHGNGLVQL
ncbi:S8 family serine peptidase [Bradyrhizobium sp. LB11.1]|uniref:S8 family peptidase n=1 Tax=Bradyrhizobium sp. LB11.1 TaxID=3156326 RepID=UPI003391FAA5